MIPSSPDERRSRRDVEGTPDEEPATPQAPLEEAEAPQAREAERAMSVNKVGIDLRADIEIPIRVVKFGGKKRPRWVELEMPDGQRVRAGADEPIYINLPLHWSRS
jgi:hypothetical protein